MKHNFLTNRMTMLQMSCLSILAPLFPAWAQATRRLALLLFLLVLGGWGAGSAQADSSQQVWAWGQNNSGQLGDGSYTSRGYAKAATGLTNIDAIAAGYDHSLALKNDGTVWAWGRNVYGKLGDGSYTSRTSAVQVSGLSGVTAIAAGAHHSLALKNDGTVWAWGYNYDGELGDGGTTDRPTAVQVPGLSGVTAIAAGWYYSLALKSDGTVWAWGNNNSGQLGDGTTTNRTSAVQVSGLSGVTAIAAGGSHSLALKSDGTVWAWGYNNSGQLGDGGTTDRPTAVQVPGLSGVTEIAGGSAYSLALKNDGTVWAWGSNGDGQLGDGTTTSHTSAVQVSGLSGVTEIAAEYYHSLALKNDGTVWAWGNNSVGQLGDGSLTNRPTAVQVPGLSGVTAIAAGGYHSLAVSTQDNAAPVAVDDAVIQAVTQGVRHVAVIHVLSHAVDGDDDALTISAVGIPANGGTAQIINGGTAILYTPPPGAIASDSFTYTISDGTATGSATVTLTFLDLQQGNLFSWGLNSSGQLGDGSYTNRTSAVQVSGLSGVTAIAGGGAHSLALKNDGTVWAWGNNSVGQLGDGSTTIRTSLVQVSSLSGVAAIAARGSHSLALKNDGTVWAWGRNPYGELGDGTTTDRSTAVHVSGLSGVTAIAAGGGYSLALKSDGTVWAWGRNFFGELGDGSYTDRTSPVQVSSLSGVTAIAAGDYHSLALKNDGTVWAWGQNYYGQLGDGTTTNRYIAVQVSGLSGVTAIAAGYYYSLALKNDGTVWAWGQNYAGELGDGTITNRYIAVQVSGLSGVTAIAAGQYHSLALKNDGTVWAWGNNGNGELGDGSTTNCLTPQMATLQGVSQIAAGDYHSLAIVGDVPQPNVAPLVINTIDNITTNEDAADTQINLGNVFTDLDGDALTYTVQDNSNTSLVTTSITDDVLTLSYEANQHGLATITVRATDGNGEFIEDTFTVTVNAVNDAPVANAQSVTTDEDTEISITLTGSDADGDDLTYEVVDGPAHGTLAGDAPNLTYTPDALYHGSDSFTFKVNDGTEDSAAVTVNITINHVNHVPTANTQDVTTDEDTAKVLLLTGSDIDGDTLTYIVVDNPIHGTLSGTAPNLTYTPDADYNGSDYFTFKVNDGTVDSDPIRVDITVTPQNDPPAADAQSVSTNEDTPKTITLNGSDIDGDTLDYVVVDDPTHGTLSGTGANLTYTPDADYHGSDSFTFKVNDGTTDSAVVTVDITVSPVNDAPTANTQSVTTDEDTAKEITLTGLDIDGDALDYIVVDDPTHGTLSGDAPNLTYTPNADYHGSDSFTFKVNDGTTDSAVVTVDITISSANDAPTANAQSVITDEDTAKEITLTGLDIDGDTLDYIVVDEPAHGTLSGEAPNLTYTPDADYHGSDSFTFKVNDGTTDSAVVTVDITISSVNDAPTANAQSVTTDEDTAKVLLLTGLDIDGDTLDYIVVDDPTHGTLSGSSANLTYTPNADYNGSDSFTFKVNDGTIDSAVVTVDITISSVNDAPTANTQSITTNEDTAKEITLTGLDIDGDTLDYIVVDEPAHGTLSGEAPNLTYTPDADYNGSDSFTFKVNDGTVDSDPATVTVKINVSNDAPVANAQSVTIDEDTAKVLLLSGSDIDGDDLTYIVVDEPAHGSLSGEAPNLTYTPNADYNGSDSFTFKVNDGTTDSAIVTVDITISSVNDAPTANTQSVTTDEDTAKEITLTGSDIDGDALDYVVVDNPTHGTLSGTGANLTYTPDADYNGSDSFTFKANDGTTDSGTATVSIMVNAINDAPIANNQTVTTNEDTAVSFTLTGSDIDGDELTYHLAGDPLHGTLSGDAPNLTYTPDADYNGSDSFTFIVKDGTTDSIVATVSVIINVVNDAPVANDQSVTTDEDTAVSITLTGSDIDDDPLTYSIVTGPSHGTLNDDLLNLTYTPDANYHGNDSFTFKANDGTVDSETATVSIAINPINDAPIADAQSVTTDEDTVKSITLAGSDIDGDDLTYIVVDDPTHGTLSGSGANLTYTPDADYNGSDSFTFKVNDGTVDSDPATVTVNINVSNDAPVANTQSVTTDEDTAKVLLLSGSDIDGDDLTYTVVEDPTHGTLSGTAPNLTYTPDADYNGSDNFTFKVNDGTTDSAVVTVDITISSVNDAPTADTQSVTTDEDTAKSITLTGSDIDGDDLTYIVVDEPAHGTLSGDAPNLTYTPDADYNGSDSFTFKVNDGTTDSETVTVNITVSAANDAPTANTQTVTTDEDTAKSITLSGSDVDGDELTYEVVDNPSHGTLSGEEPNLIYTPNADYNGSDSFTFKVNDGTVDSETATVNITVNAINDAPIANSQSVTTDEDTAVSIILNGSDVDGDELTYYLVGDPIHGTLSGDAPNLTYTPDADYNGNDSFTFIVKDGTMDSAVATVSVTINVVNDAPTADAQSVTTDEDTAKSITLSGSDVDGDTLTYEVVDNPSHGTLSGTAPNLTYTPGADYNGSDSFTFKVNDGTTDSEIVTVNITVNAANDAPTASGQDVTTDEDTAQSITLTGSDIDGDTLTYEVVDEPEHGTLSGDAPNLTYTPDADYNGSDSFTFKVNDGTTDSATATVNITVNVANDAPTANAQSVTIDENTAKSITLAGSDIDDDTLTYEMVDEPSHGTLSGDAPNLTYTPNANYNGNDSFTFKVNDGTVDSAVATVSIRVDIVNHAPIANSQNISTYKNRAVAFSLSASDADGDVFEYEMIDEPMHGIVYGDAPDLIYEPDKGYSGSDSFTFIVDDGEKESNVATVNITVENARPPVNNAPIAYDQVLSTRPGTPVHIELAAGDPDGDLMDYFIEWEYVDQSHFSLAGRRPEPRPAHGTLVWSDTDWIYTPKPGFTGTDTFRFWVADGELESNMAIVTITVR